MSKYEVIIIGAGLSGLACARWLTRAGVPCLVLDAADGIGGRVRTDVVEGFRLDRGFQVLLTAYPELTQHLDLSKLDLRPYYAGAKVWYGGSFVRAADPWRHPLTGLAGLFSPIGTLADKLRVASLRRRCCKGSLEELFERPEISTLEMLKQRGFSPAMIERFFRPLFGGVFLEAELATSSRMFEFVFRMMATGETATPALGMGEIPAQLAASLPEGTVRLRSPVQRLSGQSVILPNGEALTPSRALVIASAGPEYSRLLSLNRTVGSRSVACLYFDCAEVPSAERIIHINGTTSGVIQNLAFTSNVSPMLAPRGRSLAAVTVLGWPKVSDAELQLIVRAQLIQWFGSVSQTWKHLRTYRIHHAQPDPSPATLSYSTEISPGVFAAGDHFTTPSIDGALRSGRLAAEAILSKGKA